MATMSDTKPILVIIQTLARVPQPGAIVVAEQTIDLYARAYAEPAAQAEALELLQRDLAQLPTETPAVAEFVMQTTSYISSLQRSSVDRSPSDHGPRDVASTVPQQRLL